MRELLDNFIYEKELIEELINIDNDKMNKNDNYKSYYNSFINLLNDSCNSLKLENDSLFITEGNPLITLDLLRRLEKVEVKVVIYINQGFVAMNKWLINQFYKITNNYNIEIDIGINYNKYINMNYRVIPLGEEGLVNQVVEDFYE